MCFGCSKEPSQRDVSFEYAQHMFWLRNNKNTYLGPDLSHMHVLIPTTFMHDYR